MSLCLSSLIKHAGHPFELLVFDNASCDEARGYLYSLHTQGMISYLVFSKENVGSDMAIKRCFEMAPGTVVGHSDDDIYFYPNWLAQQLAILDHFPHVGVVSGAPLTTSFRWAVKTNRAFGERPDVTLTVGQSIPREWEVDFARSIGRDSERHLKMIENETDFTLEYKGMKAFGVGHHMQFIGHKDVLLPLLPVGPGLMDSKRPFDQAVDDNNLLRLCTIERTSRHLGNVLDEDMLQLAISHGLVQQVKDE